MRKTTVHILSITTSALLSMAGASLTVISCTKTTAPGTEASPEGAITFSGVDTKALVNSADDIASFGVWGYYVPDDVLATGEDAVQIFSGETVSKGESNGDWSYEGPLRFWQEGNSYRFFAAYPHDIHGFSLSTGDGATGYDPYISIADFDVKNSKEDLMVAQTGYMKYAEGGQAPGTVAFTFDHTLSALKFIVKADPATLEANEGFGIRILSASLYGIPVKGSFSNEDLKGHWIYSASDVSTQTSPFAGNTWDDDSAVISSTDEFSLLGDEDCLVLPVVNLSSLNAALDLTYQTRPDESSSWSEDRYRTLMLSSLTNEWMSGMKYRYTITIGDHLAFSVNVVTWNTSTGGIITVE